MPASAADRLLAAGLQPTHIFIVAKTCTALADQVRRIVLPKDVRVLLVAGGSSSGPAPAAPDALWAGRGLVVSEKNLAALLRQLDKKCPITTAFNWIAPPPTPLPVKLKRTISALFPPPSFGAYLLSQLAPETQKAVNSAFAKAIDDAGSLIGISGVSDLFTKLSTVMSDEVVEYVVCLMSLAGAIVISPTGVIEVVLATLLTLAPMPGQQDDSIDPYEELEEQEPDDDDEAAEEDEDESDEDEDLNDESTDFALEDLPEDVIALKHALKGQSLLDLPPTGSSKPSKPIAALASQYDTSDGTHEINTGPVLNVSKSTFAPSQPDFSPVSARTLARLSDVPFDPQPLTPEDGSTPFLIRLQNFTKQHFASSKEPLFCRSVRSEDGLYRCRLTVAEQSFESAYLFKDENEAAEDVARLACAFMFCWVEAAGRTEQFSGRLDDIFDAKSGDTGDREDGEVAEPAEGRHSATAGHPLIDASVTPAAKGQRPFMTRINMYVMRRSSSLTWSFPGHAPGARVHTAVLTIEGVDYASRESHLKRQQAKEDAAEVACLALGVTDDQLTEKAPKNGVSPSRPAEINPAMTLNQLCQRRGTTHLAVFDRNADGFECTVTVVGGGVWSSDCRFQKKGDAKAAACVNALRELAPEILETHVLKPEAQPESPQKVDHELKADGERPRKRPRHSDTSDRPALHHALPPRPTVLPPPTVRHISPISLSPTNFQTQPYHQPVQQYPSYPSFPSSIMPSFLHPTPHHGLPASFQYPSFPPSQPIPSPPPPAVAQQPMDINTAMAVFASVFSGPAALPLTALSSMVPGANGAVLQSLAPMLQQLAATGAYIPQSPNPDPGTSLQGPALPARSEQPLSSDVQTATSRPQGEHKRFLESA
ncbi:hypothetical protein HDU87_001053 [Geranomyces variabilis]|uniref:DRBM domain-containing protein n=1 Tax=Geranomyces variabilis TaxID=109894 RepID=A0AAD5TMV6_9FUNG|nr:hypothetical protein HDU87_001053 [Geranomyces variabilis]